MLDTVHLSDFWALTTDEATFVAPAGAREHLRSRILARHVHAMLEGDTTLITVYLEPGLKASVSNRWLL